MSSKNEVKLDGEEFILLQSLLKYSGLCESGGEAKAVIAAGEVKVDGVVEIRRGKKIRSGQNVFYKGLTVKVID